jgi:nicotinic acid phosphoribosyltransferase
MAEAGAALRTESFYYSHRRGGLNGWHFMPIDAGQYLKACLPKPAKTDYDYLGHHNYEIGAASQRAFEMPEALHTIAVPKGSWFYNREPAFLSNGPSALVSWLEPHAIALQFRIQVATAIKSGEFDGRFKYATCEEERTILEEMCDLLGAKLPWKIQVREAEYYEAVLKRALNLVEVVHNPDRIFEVGMRSVSCPQQHRVALQAILAAGIKRTSNAHLAQVLGMIPVGTMGHEHVQRIGDDYDAFCWMRDRFPGFLFYLPDTFSTLYSGIPSALKVIAETPERDAGIRFDSEHAIRGHYTFTVARAMEMGIQPRLALESGWNYDLTVEFEKLREQVKWPEDRQAYGYGGYLVKPEWPSFLRDDVSAVWKLCKTGSCAVQKFGDEPGSAKESIPGRPLIYRPNPLYAGSDTPASYILQEGERWTPPNDAVLVSGKAEDGRLPPSKLGCQPAAMSPATQELMRGCRKNRDEVLARVAQRGL